MKENIHATQDYVINKDIIVTNDAGEFIKIVDANNFNIKGLNLYGKTTQADIPTIEKPQELINVGNSGSITTKILGDNFFNPLFISTSKISPSININSGGTELDTTEYNGKITVTQNNYTDDVSYAGHYSNGMFYIKLDTLSIKLGEKYTFIADVKITNKLGGNGNLSAKDANGGSLVTFKKKDNKIYGVIIINSDMLDFRCNGMSFELSNIMLIHGDVTSSLPDYEPYKEVQTFTLNTPNGLPGVNVSSGGNYTDENGQQWVCDEIDLARGKYIQRVNKLTVINNATSEYPVVYAPVNNNIVYCRINLPLRASQSNRGIISTHFKTTAKWNDVMNNPYLIYVEGGVLYFSLTLDDIGADGTEVHSIIRSKVNDWINNTFSIDNPLIIYHEIKEPIETDLNLTDEEIAQYKALMMHKPVTNVFNDANAHMNIKYLADSKSYIDKQINKYFNPIESAILNLGGVI